MYIYKITNTKNGMTYVGSTCRPLSQRMSNHWSDARRGKDTYIAKAIRDFGRDAFTVEVIGEAKNSDEMILMEVEAIKNLNTCYPSGYNGAAGSGLWVADRRQLESVREKISAAHKGKKLSEDHKRRMSEGLKGRIPWNAGVKAGKPAWNRGVPHSEDHRAKLVASHVGKVNPNARSVEYNGQIYQSVMEAANSIGLSRMQMRTWLKNGKAQYVGSPNVTYVEDNSAARRWAKVLNCPKCGGEYSKFKSGLRYCKPCRNEKMMVAQRLRRAAKKNPAPIVPDGAVDANPPTGEPEKENSQ